jgi:hypothetical protein
MADGGERSTVPHAEAGIGQTVDALGVPVRAGQAVQNVMNRVERELAGSGCHGMGGFSRGRLRER